MNQQTIKTNKLIAVYARVSTSTQEDEGTIETQLLAVREFAQKNNYTVVKEYQDDGWSGDILARPQLDQLREDAKKKIWEAVLTYDPDRLARRATYQRLIIDGLEESGLEVLFVTTPPPKSMEEKIIMGGFKAIFAEYEREKITDRFRIGKMRKIKENHILLTEAPYGYNYIPKRDKVHGYLEINEEEAKTVRMIFDWVEGGFTIRGIVKQLQEMAVKPRKSKKGFWATSTISHLLRNTTYIGEPFYGKSFATVPEVPYKNEKYKKMKKTSRRIRPEEEWNKLSFPSIAIISKEQFSRVQETLRNNQKLAKRNRRYEYLFAGKIWCACGNRRTGEGRQEGLKQHLYYRCTARVKTFPLPPTCKECGLNVKLADQKIWNKLEELMSSPDLLAEQLERFGNNQQKEKNGSGIKIEELEREIAKLKKGEDKYLKAYEAEIITLETLRELTQDLRERALAIERQINLIKGEEREINNDSYPTKEEILAFAKQSGILRQLNFEDKQAIVRNVVEKIITNGIEITVNGFLPINSYVKFQTIHRHCWTSECW